MTQDRIDRVGFTPIQKLPRPPANTESTNYLIQLIRILEQNQELMPSILSFLHIFSKHIFTYKNNDFGFLFNATYVNAEDNFYRDDPALPSFWIDIRLSSPIAGRDPGVRGIVIREVSASPDSLIGPESGWNENFIVGMDGTMSSGPATLASYQVNDLPPAQEHQGGIVYVPDSPGGAQMIFSDGTNWRRSTNRNIVA